MNIAIRLGLATACLLLFVCHRAPAQGLGFGARGFTGGYGPGMENLVPGRGGGGASYLPSGGGFLPYTPGPGGGLGVQSRMSDLTPGDVMKAVQRMLGRHPRNEQRGHVRPEPSPALIGPPETLHAVGDEREE